jgi:hypothetical protein
MFISVTSFGLFAFPLPALAGAVVGSTTPLARLAFGTATLLGGVVGSATYLTEHEGLETVHQ